MRRESRWRNQASPRGGRSITHPISVGIVPVYPCDIKLNVVSFTWAMMYDTSSGPLRTRPTAASASAAARRRLVIFQRRRFAMVRLVRRPPFYSS